MTGNPCYKCEDRAAGCHAKCERYLTWKDIHEEELAKRRSELAASDAYLAYAKKRAAKRNKRQHNKKG